MVRIAAISLLLLSLAASCSNEDSLSRERIISKSRSRSVRRGTDSLRSQLIRLLGTKQATVGIAVLHLESGDTFSYNGDRRFPLMSVAKFPQALLLLHLADSGKLRTTDTIQYSEQDLAVRTGSSFRKDHPGKTVALPLLESMRYSIGQSDNISSNKFFALVGGPAVVETFVHRLGVNDITITTDYAHMKADSPLQNNASPKAIARLLSLFGYGKMRPDSNVEWLYQYEILTDSNRNLLYRLMVESTSGANRIKAGLPGGTVFAHKTGTSGTDGASGITAAFNDVGIVETAGGYHYAIAVFIADSKESEDGNAALMQAVSRLVWNCFGRN